MHTARIIIGSALALALSALSVVCCYVFGTHLAPGIEGQLYGALGATADALKAILPLGITAALASRQRARAITGVLLFCVISIYSFTSELGLYALSRDAQAVTNTAGQEQYRTLKDEQGRVRDRLKALGEQRPSRAVDAELGGAKQNRIWSTSSQCSDATAPASRTFCAGIERLRAELATAEESEALRVKDGDLSAKIAGLNLATVLKSADPQSEALARLTGFAPSSIKDALAILAALLIELGSGLGLFAATATDTPHAPLAKRPPSNPVRTFAQSSLKPAPGKSVPASALHEAFTQWARREGCEALTPLALGRQMTAQGYQRVKRNGINHYAGIALAG